MAKIETVDASVPPPGKRKRKKTFRKRGEKRVVHHGVVHIQASFNNTIITVTDAEGSVLAWSSAGGIGFKGSEKGRRSLPRRLRSTQATVRSRSACGPWRCGSRDPARGGNPPFGRCKRLWGLDVKSIRDVTPDSSQRVSTSETAKSLRRTERAWRDMWVLCAACVGGKQ